MRWVYAGHVLGLSPVRDSGPASSAAGTADRFEARLAKCLANFTTVSPDGRQGHRQLGPGDSFTGVHFHLSGDSSCDLRAFIQVRDPPEHGTAPGKKQGHRWPDHGLHQHWPVCWAYSRFRLSLELTVAGRGAGRVRRSFTSLDL